MVEARPFAHPPSNSSTNIANGIKRCFGEVRSFEAFKQLHLGLISEAKRKSLPAIAQVAGLDNAQSLHHFLTESPWQTCTFRYSALAAHFASCRQPRNGAGH